MSHTTWTIFAWRSLALEIITLAAQIQRVVPVDSFLQLLTISNSLTKVKTATSIALVNCPWVGSRTWECPCGENISCGL